MSTDLQVVEAELVPDKGFALSPAELKTQLDQIVELQNSVLKEGEDYGVIPGTQKPSLWKPGAEKMSYLYGLAPQRTEIVEATEDWERPFFRYVVRVTLVKKATGQVAGDGIGTCNSFERRYLKRICQQYGKNHRHNPDCYTRYNAQDADYTIGNTILKMARKRALVDAVLGCTMASHIFTQDTEDQAPSTPEEAPSSVPADDPQADQLRAVLKDQVAKGTYTPEQAQAACNKHGAGTAAALQRASADVLRSILKTLAEDSGGSEGPPKDSPEEPAEEDASGTPPLYERIAHVASSDWTPSAEDRKTSTDPVLERQTLLSSAMEIVKDKGWSDADVRKLLGASTRKRLDNILKEQSISQLRRSVGAMDKAVHEA